MPYIWDFSCIFMMMTPNHGERLLGNCSLLELGAWRNSGNKTWKVSGPTLMLTRGVGNGWSQQEGNTVASEDLVLVLAWSTDKTDLLDRTPFTWGKGRISHETPQDLEQREVVHHFHESFRLEQRSSWHTYSVTRVNHDLHFLFFFFKFHTLATLSR